MSTINSFPDSLIGEPCSGVCFVMDYVQLQFNEQGVTSLSDPIVQVGANRFQLPRAGSRDALCSLIGKEIEDILVDKAYEIKFLFASGEALIIPLDEDRRTGPEAGYYSPGPNQPIEVW